MIIVTTEEIPNKKVKETLGIARGSTVRARNMFFNVCGKNVNDSTTEWSIFFKRMLTE